MEMEASNILEEKCVEIKALTKIEKKQRKIKKDIKDDVGNNIQMMDKCISARKEMNELQNECNEKLNETLLMKNSQKEKLEIQLRQSILLLREQEKKYDGLKQQEQEINDNYMKKVKLYENVFGLKLITLPNKMLQFIFTQISFKDPDEPYIVEFCVENDNYSLKRCDPSIENMKEFETKLNSENNIMHFLKSVREEFVKIAINS